MSLEGGEGQTKVGRALLMEQTSCDKALDVKGEGGAGAPSAVGISRMQNKRP